MSIIVPEPIIVNSGGGTSSSGGSVITTNPTSNTTVVNNDTVNITTNEFQTTDNIFDINEGERGSGVSAGLAGLCIKRGTLPDYKLVFNENTGIVEFGADSGRDGLLMLPNFTSFPDGAIPTWNSTDLTMNSSNYISANAVTNVKNLDQKVNKASTVEFNELKVASTVNVGGQTLSFPTGPGVAGYVLTTDGAGNLSWTSKGGGSSTTLEDSTATTTITVEQTAADKTIRMIADSVPVITATKSGVNISTSFSFNKIDTTSTNYTVGDTDIIINYTGGSSGFINLPDATLWPGRELIINNRSNFNCTVRSLFVQNILGSTSDLLLYSTETVKMFSDGSGWI
jgi:uncharacterized protein (DUF779 family)